MLYNPTILFHFKLQKYLFYQESRKTNLNSAAETCASFETHELTDGQLSKHKTCENEFYTVTEQIFSIKKLHACSLSIKQTFKWCAFTFKNRQLISEAQSTMFSVGVT